MLIGRITPYINKILSVVNSFLKKSRPLDLVVVIGLLVFCSTLVIGLFPKVSPDSDNFFFINVLMALPLIIAIYLIFVSLRRRKNWRRSEGASSTSIRTKIAMVFMFVAILPSIPIIISSNTLINRGITGLISSDTREALDRSLQIANERIFILANEVSSFAAGIESSTRHGILNLSMYGHREYLAETSRQQGVIFQAYRVRSKSQWGNLLERLEGDSGDVKYSKEIRKFLRAHDFYPGIETSRINISGDEILVGTYYNPPDLAVCFRIIPPQMKQDLEKITKARLRYTEKEALLPDVRSGIGIFLLVVSLAIVAVSIISSLVLSANITRPVLELARAAEKVAKGNFDIVLFRKTSDELSYLFHSFNLMISQLRENREKMLQIERLKAWNQVSRRLIHEIKNPLTPIRLSAERMKRKFIEKHENIENIIISGTDTIIEEVNSLQNIMSEFTEYARLPVAKPKKDDLNKMLYLCAKFYEGHAKVAITLELDESLPLFPFDRNLMRQAMINLIKNSIEAMHDSGIVAIASSHEGDSAVIWIRDTGPGVKAEDVDNVFDPAFSHKSGGGGLGLAIVQKIVIEHNGNIECRSTGGEGAEFVIRLPLK